MTEHWFIPRHEQQELTDALGEVRDILDDLQEAQKPRIATANWNPKVTTGDRPQPCRSTSQPSTPTTDSSSNSNDGCTGSLTHDRSQHPTPTAQATQTGSHATSCSSPQPQAAKPHTTTSLRNQARTQRIRTKPPPTHPQTQPPTTRPSTRRTTQRPRNRHPRQTHRRPRPHHPPHQTPTRNRKKSCRSATRTNEPPSTTSATYSTPTTPHPNAIGSQDDHTPRAGRQMALRPTQGSR